MCDYEYFKKDKKITFNFKVPFIPKEFKEPSLFNDDGQPNEKFLKDTKDALEILHQRRAEPKKP